jgi:hypothetical protein
MLEKDIPLFVDIRGQQFPIKVEKAPLHRPSSE